MGQQVAACAAPCRCDSVELLQGLSTLRAPERPVKGAASGSTASDSSPGKAPEVSEPDVDERVCICGSRFHPVATICVKCGRKWPEGDGYPPTVRLIAWIRRRSGSDCNFGEVFAELFQNREGVGARRFVQVVQGQGCPDAIAAFTVLVKPNGTGLVGAEDLDYLQREIEDREVEGLAQLCNFLKEKFASPAAAYKEMGKRENELLCVSEFSDALQKLGFRQRDDQGFRKEEPLKLFHLLDRDFSGEVSFSELQAAMRNAGASRPRVATKYLAEELKPTTNRTSVRMGSKQLPGEEPMGRTASKMGRRQSKANPQSPSPGETVPSARSETKDLGSMEPQASVAKDGRRRSKVSPQLLEDPGSMEPQASVAKDGRRRSKASPQLLEESESMEPQPSLAKDATMEPQSSVASSMGAESSVGRSSPGRRRSKALPPTPEESTAMAPQSSVSKEERRRSKALPPTPEESSSMAPESSERRKLSKALPPTQEEPSSMAPQSSVSKDGRKRSKNYPTIPEEPSSMEPQSSVAKEEPGGRSSPGRRRSKNNPSSPEDASMAPQSSVAKEERRRSKALTSSPGDPGPIPGTQDLTDEPPPEQPNSEQRSFSKRQTGSKTFSGRRKSKEAPASPKDGGSRSPSPTTRRLQSELPQSSGKGALEHAEPKVRASSSQ